MPVKNCIITKSGITVYTNYKDNIHCKNKDNKALTDKAASRREAYGRGKAKGLSRFGSVSSEDALSWSVFRTLELENKMDIFYELIGLKDTLKRTIFWTRDTKTEKIDLLLQSALDEIEPRNLWKIQQTEPDIILVGNKTVVFNESKLGYPGQKVLGWARGANFEERHERYKRYLDGIFTDDFREKFSTLGVKFYQLMRNVIVGCHYAGKLGLDFHLSVVVNGLNTTNKYGNHKEKFEHFSKYVIDKTKLHFTTWQAIKEGISKDPALTELNNYLELHPCLKPVNIKEDKYIITL